MKNSLIKLKRQYLYSLPYSYILRRTACLGNTISKTSGFSSRINHQKSRIDYLLDIHHHAHMKAQPKSVYPFLAKPIHGYIDEQIYDFFSYKTPKAIFMDSFSELTDQRFIHKKENWSFLANYSDIEHSDEFKEKFECLGLLELDQIEESYHSFFKMVKQVYNRPLYFLHFPTVLDSRNKFQERGNEILKVLNDMEKKFSFIKSIKIDDNLVESANENGELMNFPYHFSETTYSEFKHLILNQK